VTLIQIGIALTTAIALPIILNTKPATWPNRIGCLVALAGQPLWIWETLRAGDQPGQFIVAVWLTAWYAFGVVRPRPPVDASVLAYVDTLKLPNRRDITTARCA
jgi:hypothetical protein